MRFNFSFDYIEPIFFVEGRFVVVVVENNKIDHQSNHIDDVLSH